MDKDANSNVEVETIRKGLATIKFSKELKQQIRTPWSKALIFTVYGRTVGFNFIHNRLFALWKPAGRLDCISLGQGFFLTRFSLREDYENILRRGPWFIGEHFLSIRPWEPNFQPATAKVTSLTVWVKLNELPIEYYNSEALFHIGKSIGNVLRVDTHTTTKTKRHFAGLIGHRKDFCPYTILPSSAPREEGTEVVGGEGSHSCKEHTSEQTGDMEGPSSNVSLENKNVCTVKGIVS
nr:uncharacterized protein CFP56_35861 [Quercus suber]